MGMRPPSWSRLVSARLLPRAAGSSRGSRFVMVGLFAAATATMRASSQARLGTGVTVEP